MILERTLSRSRINATDASPRSRTSPVCTRIVSPPLHASSSTDVSSIDVVLMTRARMSERRARSRSPWRSGSATRRRATGPTRAARGVGADDDDAASAASASPIVVVVVVSAAAIAAACAASAAAASPYASAAAHSSSIPAAAQCAAVDTYA